MDRIACDTAPLIAAGAAELSIDMVVGLVVLWSGLIFQVYRFTSVQSNVTVGCAAA